MLEIGARDARLMRLRAQLLDGPQSSSPREVVEHGVAFQGQDLPAVLRAIAVRSAPGTTIDEVRAAFDAGQLVRGWTMRGTLFVTTPIHYRALLAQTAARVERGSGTRRLALGLDDATVVRAEKVARKAVSKQAVSRSEMLEQWRAAGVPVDSQRGYHLIFLMGLRGVVQWGPFRGDEQLLVAAGAAVSETAPLSELVFGYLRSHGPATLEDAAWWFALPKTLVRAAIAELGAAVVEVIVDGVVNLLIAEQTVPGPGAGRTPVRLLPGFDEWFLGYRDRELISSPAMRAAIVPGGNGVFRPIVIVEGRVVGTWRRPPRSREAIVELLETVSPDTRRAIDDALERWPH